MTHSTKPPEHHLISVAVGAVLHMWRWFGRLLTRPRHSAALLGLGGEPPEEAIVWIDCVLFGLADGRRLDVDLVVVPWWHDRVRVLRHVAQLPGVHVVFEVAVADRKALAAARTLGVTCVIWTGTTRCVEPAGAAAWVDQLSSRSAR